MPARWSEYRMQARCSVGTLRMGKSAASALDHVQKMDSLTVFEACLPECVDEAKTSGCRRLTQCCRDSWACKPR